MKVTRRLRDQLGTAAREVAQQAKDRTLERLGRDEDPVPVAAPDSPGNRPQAAFAGVLDGRHLWLAVDATPGTLALRTTGDQGQVVPLASDLAEDDPRYRSVRSDLSTLPGPGAARYEVVITAPGGKVHRVWTPPLARNEPVRTPAADGVQWQVARSADGTLELAPRAGTRRRACCSTSTSTPTTSPRCASAAPPPTPSSASSTTRAARCW